MTESLKNLLEGKHKNYILPFFWQHGEDDETLLTELHKIYESGIRAVCIESRPHEQFGEEPWYEDMTLLLKECEKLGMELWLLDDKHFPTGYANDKVTPEQARYAISEQHTDVYGPLKEQAIFASRFGSDCKLLGVVACEMVPQKAGDSTRNKTERLGNHPYVPEDQIRQQMTGRTIDLTDKVENGLVFFDVPDGWWRVFIIYVTPVRDGYMDMLSDEGTQALIDAVYEPHFERYKQYFGNVFRGYFSDEPFILSQAPRNPHNFTNSHARYPWNSNVKRDFEAVFGQRWLEKLPALYFESSDSDYVKVKYYDIVTKLYEKHFSYRLGDWSREHGVEYIGHIVEDNGYHTSLTTGGHYFRSLDGQDMAGMDIVLNQTAPGMADASFACACSYDVADGAFFNYTLAKLASSHAHIQPLKKGRAMCEIFGAFGWAEGLPFMKWLTDFMLVRGINNFVPHAFTPKYPDYDCPPYFYDHGHNPEFRDFRFIMDYMNRSCNILNDMKHISSAAVLYHAEAEWSGYPYMTCDPVCKVLMQNQIDFDIIPEDYLEKADVTEGNLNLNGNSYPVFIVPYVNRIDDGILSSLLRIHNEGARVIFINDYPETTISGCEAPHFGELTTLSGLLGYLSESVSLDIVYKGANGKLLRANHIYDDKTNVVMLVNEDHINNIDGYITVNGFDGGAYIEYDAMENKAVKKYSSDGKISISLTPYASRFIFLNDDTDIVSYIDSEPEIKGEIRTIDSFDISFCDAENYDPIDGLADCFTDKEENSELYNIIRRKPNFCGFVRYDTKVSLTNGIHRIDLGQVGEACDLFVNGKKVGTKLIPPYSFTFDCDGGETAITIITVSHQGYKVRDGFSAYLPLSPVGLIGKVTIK